MGSIASMHVDKDGPVRFAEYNNDQVDEEPDNDDYDEVVNELGEENRNAHGHNGDGNNRSEGGATCTTDGGNNDANSFSMGMVDPMMFPKKNIPKKLQIKE